MASFPRAALFFLVLLVAFLCSFAITLDVDERQKEKEAFESVDKVVSRGAADEAPQPPQNLVVFPQSDTAMMLAWNEPSDTTDIDHYLVYVEDEDMEDTTQNLYYMFYNLEPCTDYIFGVMSVSAAGDTSDPLLGKGQTEAGVGGPPENLVAVGVSSSAIKVSWSPPADEPDYYVVSSFLCDVMEDRVSGLSYLITGLDPCDTCEIYVTSHYDDTQEYRASVRGTTDAEEPPPPPQSCYVQVEGDDLIVRWERPVSDCSLGSYSVHWTGTKLWGDGGKESGSGTTSGTLYHVLGTVPYSQYNFEVSSSIDGVFGSPASCNGTSPETQPGSPVIVAVDSVQGGAVVTWETPVEENGLIVEYGIFVDGATDPQRSVSGEVHGISLEREPCKTFGVSVKAKNGAGWGQPSEVKNVDYVETNCEPSGSGEVSLSWTVVDPECLISSYNVTWAYESLWSDDTGKGSQNVWKDETSFTVMSLPPYSNVVLQVHVNNSPEYTECITVTSQEKSSPPTALKQTASDNSSVTITWGMPEYIRGELEGWYLRWTTPNNEEIGEDTVSEVQRRTYTISELSKSSTYVVYASAVNGAGNGEEGEINAHTGQVPTEKPEKKENSNTGLIIGLSIAGGILLILLLVISIILFRRRRSSKPPISSPMPEVADADSDELSKIQDLSSASQGLHDNNRGDDYDTNRPSIHIYLTINEDGQMPDALPGRQVSTSLSKEEAYNRLSEQMHIKLNIFEEDNNHPFQRDVIGRPSFSGGPDEPSLGEYGSPPSADSYRQTQFEGVWQTPLSASRYIPGRENTEDRLVPSVRPSGWG